ncbi:glycoside hydrolase family 2 [Robinsoniella peoriensis]|uniref:glycoside hydrolase family 2 n=1 Tax=Robinsoniella peoriensis TaxID=180332 RepID=UPI0006945CD6|nr:glycoside hydrolase family 2 [Robinsoniella peoriensis]
MTVRKRFSQKVIAIVLAMLLGIVLSLLSYTTVANAAETGRQKIDIGSGWKFQKSSVSNAQNTNFDDSRWEDVNIPHTWNAEDGADGGSYYRGDGWYRKKLGWDSAYNNKRIYIEFLGVNMQSDVYVNGDKVGTHKGGYTAFRYDITEHMKPDKDNVLAVKVNNEKVKDIAPLSADFTFYGGIYRDVSLVLTEDVHVNTMDYASSGLKLTTGNVSKSSANLSVKSTIVNNSSQIKTVKVKAVLREPEMFEEVDGIEPLFDVASMTGTETIATVEQEFRIDAGKEQEFSKDIIVKDPRLWNGKEDPYRYQVDLTVIVDGKEVDSLTDYVGFRFFKVDYDKGFFLNGESYPLRGVCRHQDKDGKGNALLKEDHDTDFAMIYEIGANTIRLAHYPHDPYFYELCDKYGIVVWAEIPFVNEIGGSGSYSNPDSDRESFFDVTKQQMVEMIRQNINRPSICFWGLQNEVRVGSKDSEEDKVMQSFMNELNELAKKEDTSGRLTVQATDKNQAEKWPSDLQAWNRYPGWYFGTNEQLGSTYDDLHKSEPTRPMGVSEYGIGSSINHHTENPTKNAGSFQSEEYQMESNEKFLRDINAREYLWGTYYWNMFDFGSDGRNEGGLQGINTKGMVTFDRETKKDVFYLYKADWSNDPVAYITSRRFTKREKASIQVKVYSNCDSATLYMNGEEIGTLTQEQLTQTNVFVWENVILNKSENVAYLVANKGDEIYTDTVTWLRAKSDATDIQSDVLRINANNKTIQLPQTLDASTIREVISSDVNAAIGVYKYMDGMLIYQESGDVEAGMILAAMSEDESNTDFYTFIPQSLALHKTVTASSEENKPGAVNLMNHAVDGKDDTRWAANSSNYPQTYTIDLGAKTDMRMIGISWFTNSGSRQYKYKIYVSDNKDSGYTEIIDRSNNSVTGYVPDSVNVSGRYVKIEVTGSNNGGNASIHEIDIFGSDYPDLNQISSKSFEAEKAALGGSCSISTGSSCSGGQYVGNIGNGSGNKLTFNVNAALAGSTTMEIYYITQSDRNFEVTVNDGPIQQVSCPGNNTDWTTTIKKVSLSVDLKAGDNTIVVGNTSAYAPNLDRIIVGSYNMDIKPPNNKDEPDDNPGEGMIMHKIEGESGTFAGGAKEYKVEQQGQTFIYAIIKNDGDKVDGTATYEVICKNAGKRKLRIYYCSQFGSKLKVSVNGVVVQVLDVPLTGAYFDIGEDPIRLDIPLQAGINEIVFAGVEGSEYAPYVDFFNVELTQSEAEETGNILPTNPDVESAKEALNAVIKAIKDGGYTDEDYTSDSWAALEAAVNEGKAVAENKDATQQEVNDAIAAIKAAVEALVAAEPEVVVDRKALKDAIARANTISEEELKQYTDESVRAFKRVLAAAVSLSEKAGQKEADAAAAALQAAIKGLVKKPVSPSVVQKDISKLSIDNMKAQTHTGSVLKPLVAIKDGSKVLKQDVDYTVYYKNNKNPGTAQIIITGRGSYKGSVTKTFVITAKKGKTYTVGNYKYKVLSASTRSGTVSLTKPVKNILKTVKVSDTVKIGNYKYKITEIGKNAFKGNKKLKTVTIGKNVKKIGSSAFYNAKLLKKITVNSKVIKSVGKNALKGINGKAVIKVPKSKLKSYQSRFAKKGQKETVVIKK